MNRKTLALVLCVALGGCATAMQKRADTAFERGDYVTAAQLYDGAVHEKPDSEKLIEKRWLARAKAVEELALRTASMRKAGQQEPALAMARATIEARKDWFGGNDKERLDASSHRRVDELGAWAVTTVSASIRVELDAHRPLAAHAATQKARGLFLAAGLKSRFDELAQEVTTAGVSRCAELKAKLPEGAAHLAHFTAAYCQVFSAVPPSVPPSAEQVGALKIQSDTLAPTSPAQRQELEQRLEKVLIASPWFHGSATPMAAAGIAGSHTATFSQHKVPREAHWIEKVPYQVQESYQEPYTETEHYTAQEPYTEYRSESYSCGYGTSARTCSRSVPSTRYRSVQKTRSVTKYRTKHRTVTRYRDEPRIFNYEATEHRAQYDAAWDISLALPEPVPPVVAKVRGQLSAKDDEHEVSFAPAGVAPVRSRLMSHEQWFADRLPKMEAELRGALSAHWQQVFCTADAVADERAARCARGALEATPEGPKRALSAFLGDDGALLLGSR